MTTRPDEDPEVRARSRALDERRRALTSASHTAPRPPLARLGAIIVLVVALFLLVAQWELYPTGQTGQTNGLRDLGLAIVAGQAALRVLLGQPGRHLVSSMLLVLAGVALVFGAWLAAHDVTATLAAEATCGTLLVLSGAMSLGSPDTTSHEKDLRSGPARPM